MKSTSDIGKKKILDYCLMASALLMIFYHFISIWFPVFNAVLHQNIHLGFCLILLFLAGLRNHKGGALNFLFSCIGIIASIICVVYIYINYDRLSMWAGFPEPMDVAIGLTLSSIVIFLTWKEWGYIFPTLVLISILYAFLGHLIEGTLGHSFLEAKLIISGLGIGLEGIYGMMLNASANLIYLFIIFGSIFEVVGINKLFIELGTFLGRYVRGGAAQTAIVSSSFVGMCTGSAPANVALTGSYTIPLMKETGFQGKHAAAIEAAASSGGQLTPPIMGVAIFIMAGFLGMSYTSLMLTALIPAIFYYGIVILGAFLIASREGIPKLKTSIDKNVIIKRGPIFIIPMSILTCLLILHYTPGYAAFFAIFSMILISMLRKETTPSFPLLIKGLVKGAVTGASIGIACATIGMFMKMLSITGAASKLASISQMFSEGHLILGLAYAMVLSILLGCAMPIVVAYVINAIVVCPLLIDMGLPAVTAHFFVFYFAILSSVTPPVAAAAMVGSKIANSNYMRTGWESFKLILPFFLVPYFLVKNPIIMGNFHSFSNDSIALLTLTIACGSALVACQGYFLIRTNKFERTCFFLVALFATGYGFYGALFSLILALIILCIAVTAHLKRKVKLNVLINPTASSKPIDDTGFNTY